MTVRKDLEKKQTPIMDGDARPDKMIEPQAGSKKKKRKQQDDEGVSSARAADVNKLEDYKDAK